MWRKFAAYTHRSRDTAYTVSANAFLVKSYEK